METNLICPICNIRIVASGLKSCPICENSKGYHQSIGGDLEIQGFYRAQERIATTMLIEGEPVDKVVKYTGMDEETINKIVKRVI